MKAKELWIWIGIIAATLGILWGLIVLVNSSNSSTPPVKTGTPKPVSKDDITLGATSSAKITLIEYADFQCPACSTIATFIKQASIDFKSQLEIVYRFFPLTNIHQNSMTSAQAAYAAHKQNKFWEMSELLYQNQEAWANLSNPQQLFTDYAKKLNLNITQFTNDYLSDATKKFINNQAAEGFRINIIYTPSLFIDGKLIENTQNYEAFKEIIQNEINSK